MLPTNNEKEDSSNLFYEKSKQAQDEMLGDSLEKPLVVIGILFFVVIITWTFFEIENIPSKPKLFAWSSKKNNKISIAEIETQREFTNFDGVRLNEIGSVF